MSVEIFPTKFKPNLLSRGTLELTFRILRKKQPSLALKVRNQLLKQPTVLISPRSSNYVPFCCDHFNITLQAQSVGKIVQALTQAGQRALDHKSDEGESGQMAIIRELIYQWIALAEWITIGSQQESEALSSQ